MWNFTTHIHDGAFKSSSWLPKIRWTCFVNVSFSYQLPKKSANRHNESSALHDTCLLEQPTNQISSNWNDPNKKCQLVGCKLHFNTSPPQPPCKQASTACKKSVNYTTPKQTNLSRIPPRQPPVLPLISIGEIKPSTRLQAVTLKPWKPNQGSAGKPMLASWCVKATVSRVVI